jgi:Family of unknown function (DUF5372)
MRVTHRFHPLFGRDFEFVAHRQNWGEDRVSCFLRRSEILSRGRQNYPGDHVDWEAA